MAFRWPSEIRFVDTDASGRIHYSAIFRHFEAAEYEFLKAIGASYWDDRWTQQVSFPRVHVECDYLLPLTHGDQIETEVAVERIGTSSFTFSYTVWAKAQITCKGRIVIACMDRRTKQSCAVPTGFLQAIQPQP